MTNSHLTRVARRTVFTPQTESMRGDQVQNSAGGFAWAVDNWTHLRRFLILGSAGGTFYIGEADLTKQGLDTIKACLAEDGLKTVAEIATISEGGRAAKNDYAIFALSCAVAFGDDKTKAYALNALGTVCRIGTHLFQFVNYLEAFGCLTGRAKRRALAAWYTSKNPDALAYQVIKYRNREGWTHRDILRVSHPGSISEVSDVHASIFSWIAGRDDLEVILPEIINGFELLQNATKANEAAELIAKYGLPREAVPTELLKSPEVWDALLHSGNHGMPITAMIRNLGNMTRIGLLTSQSDATAYVVQALKNDEAIANSRIHPLNVLFALKTYQSGHGFRGTNTWSPVSKIVDALDGAFYKAFGNVEPTGKRTLLALDVSGSMTQPCGSTGISCYEGVAAMALVTEAVEDRTEIMAFSSGFVPLDISSRQRMDDVFRVMRGMPFQRTDCSVPMLYAMKNGLEFDAFIIYTDNETWSGNIHPAQALAEYRKKFVSDAKLVTVGMTSGGFSIADPKDPGMLDVVGFDTAAPNIISEFVSGRI